MRANVWKSPECSNKNSKQCYAQCLSFKLRDSQTAYSFNHLKQHIFAHIHIHSRLGADDHAVIPLPGQLLTEKTFKCVSSNLRPQQDPYHVVSESVRLIFDVFKLSLKDSVIRPKTESCKCLDSTSVLLKHKAISNLNLG